MTLPAGRTWHSNVDVVAYHDLDGRPGFKMGIHEADGRWYLYLGQLWHRGWTIVDVTEPASPRLVATIEGPANTWTIQMQVAGGLMVTALEQIDEGWGGDRNAPFDEGLIVWSLDDPESPRRVGRFETGGSGMHRVYWDGGRYVHAPATPAGYDGHIYLVVDLADPARPREAGRWWLPGQWRGGGEGGVPVGTSLHAACIDGARAYLAYGAAGLVILDIANVRNPQLLSRLPLAPPFNPVIAAHTAMPLGARGLVALSSEAIEEDCDEPLCFAGLVEVHDPTAPRAISMLPTPLPPPDAGYADFCARGGRSGPHNAHQAQGHPSLLARDDLLFMTWFNAGLRIFDTTHPRAPREVGWFLPPDPSERRGLLPARRLAAQSEDVLVDRRGFIYLTDKNLGLYVLRFTG